MILHSFRIWRVLVWTLVFTAIGLMGLHRFQYSNWYKDHLYHKLVAGDPDQRWSAATSLAQVGAEDRLLQGLQSAQPEVRELSRRALENFWFVVAGRKAFQMTEEAIQAIDREDYAKALETLNQLVSRYPHYAEGWNRRASLYWQIGEYEKSIADCQRVLELNPKHYGAWQGIGVCQLQLGDIAAACQSLRTVLKIVPHDEATRRSLIKCEELLRSYPPPAPPTDHSLML